MTQPIPKVEGFEVVAFSRDYVMLLREGPITRLPGADEDLLDYQRLRDSGLRPIQRRINYFICERA